MHKEKKLHGIPVQGQGGTDSALKNEEYKENVRCSEDTIGSEEERLKILFFHNTLPEYRIGWFTELSKLADVDFVFTNEELNKKAYGFDIDYERFVGLKYTFLAEGKEGERQLDNILENVADYDFVELPPIDSYREVVCGKKIVKACKRHRVRIGYFWEKWEAPRDRQPVKRRIKNLILRKVPKMIYKHSDIYFAVGCKSKEYFISNGVDERKIAVIPDVSETPPCDYEDIRIKYRIPKDKKIVMFLGRMMPQKGVQCLIRAFEEMNPEIRGNSHLLIAGDGADRNVCEKLAADLNIKNITFAGAVEPRSRGNYFAQCDVFVYPVTYYAGCVDVWGLAVNEAVQHGKVVIATDAVGSAYELIEDGVNGFRVEPGNVWELKEAMGKAMDTKMAGIAAVKDAKLMEVYNFRAMAGKYVEAVIWKGLIENVV